MKEGDKFEVFQPVENKDKTIEWKKIGTIKVAKNGVWDNSEGAGQTIEGEAQDGEENNDTATLSYTVFEGKPGKMGEGCMIRLAKK